MATQNQDFLFLFLARNASQLKLNGSAAIENIYKKIKINGNMNYDEFMISSESNLRDRLKISGLKASQRTDIIEVLKVKKETYIYKESQLRSFLVCSSVYHSL